MEDPISDYELYLYFSSLPRFAEASLDWLPRDYEYAFGEGMDDESWWVTQGVKVFKEMMADEIASSGTQVTHIIPLSGGFDSRAILGGLLENLPKSKIVAATYGIPGTWDFEISKDIAHKYGIEHEIFDLSNDKWDIDQLIAAAESLRRPVSPYQSYVRHKINNHFGADCVYWTGFMGDSIGGWNLPNIPNTDKREAIKLFLNIEPTPNYKDEAFKSKIIEKILAEFPWDRLSRTKLSIDQQLNFCLRQNFLLQPTIVLSGFVFKTPFLNRNWVNFMLNAPYKLALDQYLYRKVIQECYADLWKMRSASAYGMPSSAGKYEMFFGKVIARLKPLFDSSDPYRSHPRTNYINWTESLRHKGYFQDTVYTTLVDLKKRAIIDPRDIDTWWSEHLNRRTDYTVLLMNLSSLELLLKAGVMA
ncbi:MAG: hypothetical protein HY865_20100 [Chloroflexi bacterium]|nr:hypothetical protein [Chloroflexota bacterium]